MTTTGSATAPRSSLAGFPLSVPTKLRGVVPHECNNTHIHGCALTLLIINWSNRTRLCFVLRPLYLGPGLTSWGTQRGNKSNQFMIAASATRSSSGCLGRGCLRTAMQGATWHARRILMLVLLCLLNRRLFRSHSLFLSVLSADPIRVHSGQSLSL